MTNRREFIKQIAAVGMGAAIAKPIFAQNETKKDKLIWANLLHLSYNMWEDTTPTKYGTEMYAKSDCMQIVKNHYYQPELTFEKDVWDMLLKKMVEVGMNMVIIDLGDGVKYDSHPEIAVKGAWSPIQLKEEVNRIREMGLEPIPKLNFSAGHKAWLGPYQRMISSEKYYNVCKNLIEEVCDIFKTPRFFHLGMDEETVKIQKDHVNLVVRQGDLWWHDFYYLVSLLEKENVRPWIWSDYVWDHPNLFFKKMPKSVLQSNWYYGIQFEKFDNPLHEKYVRTYDQLEEHGFDQVPTASNWDNDVNFKKTVNYCKQVISPERLKGFMHTTWSPTLTSCLSKHLDVIQQVSDVLY